VEEQEKEEEEEFKEGLAWDMLLESATRASSLLPSSA
jgi:hypothetical protein